MGELLEFFQVMQGLDAEKAAEAREARVAQALQEYTRQVDEHRGILTQHAGVINGQAATIQKQTNEIQILRAERDGDAWLLRAQFAIFCALTVAISLAAGFWIRSLNRRIKRLEAVTH